jgi:putative transposase
MVMELKNLSDEQFTILSYLTYHAGKLWNQANYLIHNKKVEPLSKKLYTALKDTSAAHKALPNVVKNYLYREVQKAWVNFFKSCKNNDKSKSPHYMNKEFPHRTIVWCDRFWIEGTKIRLSLSKEFKKFLKEKHKIDIKYLYLDTKYKDLTKLNIMSISIIPQKIANDVSFRLNITHRVNIANNLEIDINQLKDSSLRIMGIDYGVTNFATCVISHNDESFIVDGKGLKHLLYPKIKKLIELQNKKDNLKNNKAALLNIEKKIYKIQKKIKNTIRDFYHKAAIIIKKLALKYNIKIIVIGNLQSYQNHSEHSTDISKLLFKHFPFLQVTRSLRDKLEGTNIKIILEDEIETSLIDSTDPKAGFMLINNQIKIHKGNGERVKRGLFRTGDGKYINADVNAARNIINRFLVRNKIDINLGTSGLKKVTRIRVYKFNNNISNDFV